MSLKGFSRGIRAKGYKVVEFITRPNGLSFFCRLRLVFKWCSKGGRSSLVLWVPEPKPLPHSYRPRRVPSYLGLFRLI